MAAAKPQAKISRRFASKDPDAEVPSVAASHRCSATMTAARMRGFRGIPCRTLAFRGEVLTRIYFMRKAAGPGTNPRRRALPDTGRFRERLYLAQSRPCLGLPAFERVAVLGLDGGGEHAFGRFLERWPGQYFIRQFHGRGNQCKLPAHRALH